MVEELDKSIVVEENVYFSLSTIEDSRSEEVRSRTYDRLFDQCFYLKEHNNNTRSWQKSDFSSIISTAEQSDHESERIVQHHCLAQSLAGEKKEITHSQPEWNKKGHHTNIPKSSEHPIVLKAAKRKKIWWRKFSKQMKHTTTTPSRLNIGNYCKSRESITGLYLTRHLICIKLNQENQFNSRLNHDPIML